MSDQGLSEILRDKVVVLPGVGPGLGRALGEQAALLVLQAQGRSGQHEPVLQSGLQVHHLVGLAGLAGGKRVIVIVASGADLRPESPMGASNFVEPYLRAVFGFIGIARVEFVYAHSLNHDAAAGTQAMAEAESTLTRLAVPQAA